MPRPEMAPPVEVEELVTKGYVLTRVSLAGSIHVVGTYP